MNPRLVQLLVHWVVMALGVTLATKLVDGISCDSTATLIVVVLLLNFFNAIIKPVLVLFTLPFIVLTLGLGVVVINALLFMLVGRLVDGFHVAGFWPAVWGGVGGERDEFDLEPIYAESGRAAKRGAGRGSAASARPAREEKAR